MKRSNSAVAAALFCGALLRLYGVLRFPFEQDELYTVDEATNLFHTHLLPGIQARPVFFFLEHPFMGLVPHTEGWLRLIPFLFGVAGLWVVWRAGRALAGPTAAAVALALVIVSPWHLYASAFGRYYSLLFLLAGLIYWLLPRAYDIDEPPAYLATLVPLLIGTWTHPSFTFPVAGAVLGVSLISRNGTVGWRRPSRNAWAFLYGPFLIGSAIIAAGIRIAHPASSTVANGGDRGMLASLRLIPAMLDWMTPTVGVAFVAGLVLLLRSGEPSRRRLAAMGLFASVSTLLALFGLSFVTSIYADYGIAALPLILVIAAYPVEWAVERIGTRGANLLASTVTAIMLAGILPSAASYLSDGTRFDYRAAYAKIAASSPSTTVLTWPIIQQRHYAPLLSAQELPVDSAGLATALKAHRDLWVVTSVKRYGIVGDDTGEMERWLTGNCRQADQFQRPRFDYRMYRVDLWRCTDSPRL